MNNILNNSAFLAYAITCLVLCANLLFLWVYSGAMRGKSKTVINEEDVHQFGASLTVIDPPPVARALRAHHNAQASIYPFLLLGLVFVLAGGTAGFATILFGIFTLARLVHSIAYLRRMQPWRTVSFVVGGLATIALMLDIVWLIVRVA
ncbi:MAG: MAPEG family protein [Pseudomonadota bacterium]